MTQKIKSFIKLPFGTIILSLLVVFVIFQFFLQGSIGIMSYQLKLHFQLDAAKMSILSSAFFYSYIILQIPAGILIDTFGIKKCIVWASLVMSLGCLFFAFSNSLNSALLSRVLMGLGASFGFLSMLKSIKIYFRQDQFPLIMSLTELFSTTGVAIVNYIVSLIISYSSWKLASLLCSAAAFFLAISLFICFKYEILDTAKKSSDDSFKPFKINEILKGLKEVIIKPSLWLNGIYCGCMFSIITVFVALWGVPYIKTHYGLDTPTATSIISCIYIGVSLSSPFIGFLARYFSLTKLIKIGTFLSLILFAIILYFPPSNYFKLYPLMFFLGAFCSSYQLSFSLVSKAVNSKQQGSATGLVNMLCMLSAPIIQPIIGLILSSTQNGVFDNYEEYTSYDYKIALSILLVTLLCGLILSFKLQDDEKSLTT